MTTQYSVGGQLFQADDSDGGQQLHHTVKVDSGDITAITWEHELIHDGEMFSVSNEQLAIAAGTVKYGITTLTNKYPHILFQADCYNGAVLVNVYTGSTISGGSTLSAYNRNQASTITPTTVIMGSVTSTNGTKIDSFIAGTGKGSGGAFRSDSEWVLDDATIYRIDVIGQAAGTEVVVRFLWYEENEAII
jgi:hypothetical protein